VRLIKCGGANFNEWATEFSFFSVILQLPWFIHLEWISSVFGLYCSGFSSILLGWNSPVS
jgi:hypothetical protein